MSVTSDSSAAYLHIDFPKAPDLNFNRARVRRAFISIGRQLLRDARRKVSRRAISCHPTHHCSWLSGRL